MKKIIFFLYFFILPFSFLASERVDEHIKASETFVNWHFFENGRGMTITPNLSRLMWMLGEDRANKADVITQFIERKYGLIVKDNKLMGVFNVKYKNMDVGVLGCTACHSGKAAGIFIPGLGNKTIDPYVIGRDNLKVQRIWGQRSQEPEYKYIYDKAMYFAKVTSDPQISSLTRGLVPDSTIKTFFYKDHGIPYPKDMGRAQVKAPHLWGIKEKRQHGVFNEGSLNGNNYAWIFGAELFASDSGDHLRAVLPKIQWLTDEVLGNLLPPKYPYKVKLELVPRGKQLFDKNCFQCHGEHQRDSENLPIYTAPKIIHKEIVKTDPEKLNSMSPEFIKLVETGSLGDILTFNYQNIQKGYFAPKLWGIWSRFPYLHNGSVPNLYQLMIPPKDRSPIFSMIEAGEEYRFDRSLVGLTLFPKTNFERKLRMAKKGERDIYYIEREGQSNQGHYYRETFSTLTHLDRISIIEYLKTL